MTEGGTGGAGYLSKFQIDAAQARELLTRLAIDFEYRELLESNPAEALRKYFPEVSDDDLPMEVDLPEPHQILRVLAVMQEQDLLTPDRTPYVVLMWILPAFPVVAPAEGDAAG